MKARLIFFLVLCLTVSGCATWANVGGRCDMRSQNFTVDLPDGWHRYSPVTNKVIITKQGMSLQRIIIFRTPIDQKLPFTQKKISTDMLPQEVAEIVIDNLKSNPNVSNVDLVENDPISINGQPGFKIVYTFQTQEGLANKGVFYGLLTGGMLYKLVYEAPQRYYFEKDRQTFESVMVSFRLAQTS